jgi:hypothetical protein
MTMSKAKNETKRQTLTYEAIFAYIGICIQEVVEAALTLGIIRIAVDKPIYPMILFKESLLIGLLTFILENWNHDFKNGIRAGLTFTVGAQLASRAI